VRAPPAFCLAILLALAVPGRAQETPWPLPRAGHSMVWHDGLGAVVLYGGTLEGRDTRWLWSWDGLWWDTVDSLGPPATMQFGMAYDAGRETLVLFGGLGAPRENPTRYADTWEWNGAWKRIDVEGPPARDHLAMAYDPERRVVVLFGGGHMQLNATGEPEVTLFDDTWTWDGERWRRLDVTGPPARATHRMVWDDRSKAILLFGGGHATGNLADLWKWDGAAWTLLDDGSGPSPRLATRIAWHSARGELVLYGGRGAGGDLDDTWTWNGSAWDHREVEGLGPLNVHEMAYDPRRELVVLFGGFHSPDHFADVWEWDGEQWGQSLPD